jgi:ribosomal protein L44E
MDKSEWLLCPICKNKTRIKLRQDTILLNFPLYCPKCKQENLINVKQLNIFIIKEPDVKTQSR